MNNLPPEEPKSKPPLYIRKSNVSKYFELSARQAQNLIDKRKIKATKTEKLWLIETASLVKYLESRSNLPHK